MEEGTIVHIDYDLFNADSEKLIETTREEVAKEHDAHDENRTYSPMVTVVGDGRLIPGFETHLGGAEAETDYSFDIEPAEAYGERDASLVETIGQNVLMRSVRDPEMLGIGAPVEIGGRTGVLQFLSAGRARIDYNHPLAGATLRYDYRITKVVEDRKEKVETLLEMNTGRDDFEVEFNDDDLTITTPEEIAYDQNWAFTKFSLVRTLRDHLGVGIVVFREVHEPRAVTEEE
ncbi:MAG: FKBP-type peptidyl-prolyl cis-trans isomerase [Candidatus Thalassarchaeum sp.]|nr:FKBP-type peptidyl-prolyl cis-trans isomerase [Candidatus Thalassarchaeum sp.]MEC8913860.1 FKBP-type peptidyl-prolyl cis-trans isomerase [Candidatus Thermoplasmatota archaeon]MEE2606781.1 FKBP-type peptidyl-prolyl cis-trans isomerase [Candidatus Thermoplasmatota archaeon]